MKKLILVLATLGMFSVAQASTNATTNNDLSYIGVDASQTQLMSKAEMKETEGAFLLPGALFGAALGYGQYEISCRYTNSCTWSGRATNTAFGAAAGFVGGPVSSAARAIWAVNVAGSAGIVNGVGSSRKWW
jgi:hypothetical protein